MYFLYLFQHNDSHRRTKINISNKVDSTELPNIVTYAKVFNELGERKIGISFMEDDVKSVSKDDFCIPHTMLVKSGVVKDNNVSGNVKTYYRNMSLLKNIL